MVLPKLKKRKPKVEPEGDYEGMEEEDLEDEEIEQQRPARKVKKVKRRYAAVESPQRIGVIDTETSEMVAEGEHAVLELLANILERLERMEATIGSLIE